MRGVAYLLSPGGRDVLSELARPLPGRPGRPVVLVPAVVQVVLAWCPFTQWEQHFVKELPKNCSLQGGAPIFISWPTVFFLMF